jgi:transcriptional regulator with XRE-family HTH domain
MSLYTQIINLKMAALDLTQAQLSHYSGVHNSRLSPFLSGTRELDATSLNCINQALLGLETLQAAAAPWVLDLRKVTEIKRLLTQLKQGELDHLIESTRQAREALDGSAVAAAGAQ